MEPVQQHREMLNTSSASSWKHSRTCYRKETVVVNELWSDVNRPRWRWWWWCHLISFLSNLSLLFLQQKSFLTKTLEFNLQQPAVNALLPLWFEESQLNVQLDIVCTASLPYVWLQSFVQRWGVALLRCHAIILSACLQGAVISPTTGRILCLWEAFAIPPSGFTLLQAVISQIFVFPLMLLVFFSPIPTHNSTNKRYHENWENVLVERVLPTVCFCLSGY